MAVGKDKLIIHIRIGNLPFPIEVPYEKEEAFRWVERMVNEELDRYRQRYQGQSQEKYMAMVLIDIGVKYFYAQQRHDTAPFVEALTELAAEIETALSGDNEADQNAQQNNIIQSKNNEYND